MSQLQVKIAAEPATFRPGDFVSGEAEWTLDEPAGALELKLCWTTRGSVGGDADPVVVVRDPFPVEGLEGRREFRFELPEGPWSFEGKLFSVCWYVELARDEYRYGRADFAMGPGGRPIVVAEAGSAPMHHEPETPPEAVPGK